MPIGLVTVHGKECGVEGLEQDWQAHGGEHAVTETFVCMGGMTLASAWIFWQLSPQSAWVRRMVHDIGPD